MFPVPDVPPTTRESPLVAGIAMAKLDPPLAGGDALVRPLTPGNIAAVVRPSQNVLERWSTVPTQPWGMSGTLPLIAEANDYAISPDGAVAANFTRLISPS